MLQKIEKKNLPSVVKKLLLFRNASKLMRWQKFYVQNKTHANLHLDKIKKKV